MTTEPEPPRYTPREAQTWSKPKRSHCATCEECGPLFSDTTGDGEHWVFTAARDHCAASRHVVTIESVIRISVGPPSDD